MSKVFFGVLILLFLSGCGESSLAPKEILSSTVEEKTSEKDRWNNPVSYNPEFCKTDSEGMMYFAAGRDVFKIPYTNKINILDISEEDKKLLPKRPDPSEPEGCFDNPIEGTSFSVGYKHQPKDPGKYPDDISFTVESLSIIAISPKYVGTRASRLVEDSNQEAFRKRKV